MAKPSPLDPQGARGSLAHRLSRRVDRIRQIGVRLGVRPYRVFLTWTRYTGEERGEGRDEDLIARIEVLPTPRVADLTALTYRTSAAGTYPEGSVRVDRVSSAAYTEDVLRGRAVPTTAGSSSQPIPGFTAPPEGGADFASSTDFFWEVVEDGRGDDPAERKRFRLMGSPFRQPGAADWTVLLQRASRDVPRDGVPTPIGVLR